VRPALILISADGTERRLLAELDDKPWAAQDGEPWKAAFLVDADFAAATALELSVAPDINVPLRGDGDVGVRRVRRERGPVPAKAPAAPSTRAPAAPSTKAPAAPSTKAQTPPGRRPASRAPDTERLTARLAAAQTALEGERERRGETEAALERHQAEARRLNADLGRAQADLELAKAAERDAAETAALLDAARRDNHAARARYEALAAEHELTLRSEAGLQDDLRSRDTELKSARTRLKDADKELTELTERLRHAEQRGAQVHEREHDSNLHHIPPPPRSDRPVNPSLHHHNWFLRFIVLIVIAAFLLAVYFVLHSTVLSN
jgi:hypothetical protein